MIAPSSRLAACVLGALCALGCIRDYEPPTAAQPHAILKVRRSYENVAGASLRERVMLDEYRGFEQASSAHEAATAHTDALLIHPQPLTVGVVSKFFHVENRLVTEWYTEQESYLDNETYNCGSGTEYRMCSRMVTRYRSVPRSRQVWRRVEVSDGACQRFLRFAPALDKSYLLQYTYQEPGVCALSCFEQLPSPPGQVEQQPCPIAPPEQ